MNVYTLRLSGPDVEYVLGAYSHPQLAVAAGNAHAAKTYQRTLEERDWHWGDDGDAIVEIKREQWSDYYSVDRQELDAEPWP